MKALQRSRKITNYIEYWVTVLRPLHLLFYLIHNKPLKEAILLTWFYRESQYLERLKWVTEITHVTTHQPRIPTQPVSFLSRTSEQLGNMLIKSIVLSWGFRSISKWKKRPRYFQRWSLGCRVLVFFTRWATDWDGAEFLESEFSTVRQESWKNVDEQAVSLDSYTIFVGPAVYLSRCSISWSKKPGYLCFFSVHLHIREGGWLIFQ